MSLRNDGSLPMSPVDEHCPESHGSERSKAAVFSRERAGARSSSAVSTQCTPSSAESRPGVDRQAVAGVLVEDAAHVDRAGPAVVARAVGEAFAERQRVAVVHTEHDRVGVLLDRGPHDAVDRRVGTEQDHLGTRPSAARGPARRERDRALRARPARHARRRGAARAQSRRSASAANVRGLPRLQLGDLARGARDRRGVRARPSTCGAGRARPARRHRRRRHRRRARQAPGRGTRSRTRPSSTRAARDVPSRTGLVTCALRARSRERADGSRRSPRHSGSVRPRSAAPG